MACLSRDTRTLQSVASTAPYLGLAGTCLGILDSFRGVGMQRFAALVLTVTWIAASLLTTVAGVLVAVSSAASYNYLLWLIGRLEKRLGLRDRISSKFPLKEKFSKLPAFPLMAAPSLAVALAAFMIFPSFHGPVGLPVRLLKQVELQRSRDSSAPPILIGLSEINAYEEPTIYVNSKQTSWDDLDSSLREKLRVRRQTTVYVGADNDVRWADVAMVIDSVKAHSDDVVLLTIASELSSRLGRQSGKSKK
ncbi:MAG TPA: MotA/TolQ/ExbB proton channel family protein [Candidatus Sulfotelmatobacter sp.]|nr:MotA/TolQ/ExbB proton channel family protein [Candidatus Sulfotelmatobacter sp.]